MDNAELGYLPSLFKEIYEYAINNEITPVAHAGEEAPPNYIIDAIDNLHVLLFFSLFFVFFFEENITKTQK